MNTANTQPEVDEDYAQVKTPAHLQDPIAAYPPEQRDAVQRARDTAREVQ